MSWKAGGVLMKAGGVYKRADGVSQKKQDCETHTPVTIQAQGSRRWGYWGLLRWVRSARGWGLMVYELFLIKITARLL